MGTTIMGTSCATDSSPSSKFPSRCGTPAIKNIPSHINTISRCDTPTSIQGGITRIAPKRFASPVPSHALPAFLTSAWQYDHETLRANVFSIFIHPPPYYSYDDEEWAVDEEHDSYVDDYEYDSSESSGSSSDRELTPTVGASTIPFPGTDYMDAVPVLDEEQLRRNLEMVQSLPVGNFTHCDGNCDCCKEDYLKVEVNKKTRLFENVTDTVSTDGKAASRVARRRTFSISGDRHRTRVFKSSPLAQKVIPASSICTERVDPMALLGLVKERY